MADNIAVTEGSGKTVATDDVAGVQYQRVKVDLGGDGAASPLVRGQQTKASSLPVTLASDEDALGVTANGNIGQQTKAASLPVTLASDEDDIEVVQPTHDDFNANVNLQVADSDVAVGNPVPVAGTAAHDAAAAGNSVRVGGIYKALASGDEVDDDDHVDLLLTALGELVLGRHPGAWNETNTYAAAQTATQQKAAPGAGLSLYIKTLTFSSNGSEAGALWLHDEDDNVVTNKFYFPASAGMFTVTYNPARKLAANKALEVTTTGANDLSLAIDGYTKAVAA